MRQEELPSSAGTELPKNAIVLRQTSDAIDVEVLAVIDGDTFVARREDRLLLMILQDVEAPEVDRPGGREARDRLAAHLAGRRITVRTGRVDDCVVSVRAQTPDGEDVAETMLVEGYLIAKPSAPEPWRQLEAQAQARRRGLWRTSRDR